jgi:SAM-dependent methyltransferase
MQTKKNAYKASIKRIIPGFVLRKLHQAGFYKSYKPDIGKINFGDLKRCKPFSYEFGYDRGGPVDRYYIENFLQKNSPDIKGRVLEIGDNEYTVRFGGSQVMQSDILHVDATNTKATFIGDLSESAGLPSDSFDCIILTQTLHLIYDFEAALRTCKRILKKNGCLLITVPGISQIDYNEWSENWLWSFTKRSLQKALENTFVGDKIEIGTFGNVFIATCFLYGVGLPEVPPTTLGQHDPNYQVIIAAKAIKK